MSCSAVVLAEAVAPASLRDTLEALRRAGAINGWTIDGDIVTIDGDMVALELAVMHGESVLSPKLGIEVDDLQRGRRLGFRVSSDIDGRRGGATARAADMEASRSYYERAQALLHDSYLSSRARRIWELHVEGLSEEKIAASMGMARRRVVRVISVLRCRAGLTREVAGWAIRTDE